MFVEQIAFRGTSSLYPGMVGNTLSTRFVVLFVRVCFLCFSLLENLKRIYINLHFPSHLHLFLKQYR